MKITILLYFVTAINFAYGQCSFVTNLKSEEIHELKTNQQILVEEKNMQYNIFLENSHNGITAVISYRKEINEKGNSKFQKGDQIMFISDAGEKRTYSFLDESKSLNEVDSSVLCNTFQLNREEMKWIAQNSIKEIRFVRTTTFKMFPYKITVQNQEQLKKMASCFLKNLIHSKEQDKAVNHELNEPKLNSNAKRLNNDKETAQSIIH